MSIERGALLVLEGCDRAGKSTQMNMLLQALHDRHIPAAAMAFPDRTTKIGSKINLYLKHKEEADPGTIHLLFSQNRWERANDIIKTLNTGKTLVVDRYAASGAAYAAAYTGKDLEWCKDPDRGLPLPDLVAYLKVDEETQSARSNWGEERFEKADLQRKVATNFLRLRDENWEIMDANRDVQEIHKKLLKVALEAIQRAKNMPIGKLYTSR